MHLYALNRGVLITPFHNMALMCPATTEADVDLHTQVFDAALGRACRRRAMTVSPVGTGRIDPITFEVLRNAFMSVVDEMGLMLERVGHSLVVSERRKFSAAICDVDGRMVAEGKEDMPAHVGTLPHTVKAVISWIGREAIHEGDIFIMNDAFPRGHPLPGRPHDHAGVPRRRARRVRPEFGALVQRRRPRSRAVSTPRQTSTLWRNADTSPRSTLSARASSTTSCCASSCATCTCRRRPRATRSRSSTSCRTGGATSTER